MTGFVYLWFDRAQKKFYLGSHLGRTDDGYICSSRWMLAAFRKRPDDFRRRILEQIEGSHDELLAREQAWLNLISDSELSVRYYNHKRIAKGGSNKGHTKAAGFNSNRKGVTAEMFALRRKGLLCLPWDRPKQRLTINNAKSCPSCGGTFKPRNKKQVSCSRSCATKLVMSHPEARAKVGDATRGKVAWNKGKPNQTSAENGRAAAEKLRKLATGRKRQYREDGTWSWVYPQ